MVQQSPGTEGEGIRFIRQLALVCILYRKELAATTGKLVFEEIGRAGMVGRGTGPMDAPFTLNPFIGDPVKGRGNLAHLCPDVTGMGIAPVGQHIFRVPANNLVQLTGRTGRVLACFLTDFPNGPSGDIDDNLPIGSSLAGRRDSFADELNTPVGVGEGTVFFGKGSRRQEDVSIARRFVDKDILGDVKLQLLNGVPGMIDVRLTHQRILAHHIPALHLAVQNTADHFSGGQTRYGR